MYHERIIRQSILDTGQEFDPMLGNIIQKDLILEMSPDNPMDFIQKHAEKFRELFDAHPEWREMYKTDPENTLKIIKEMLESSLH